MRGLYVGLLCAAVVLATLGTAPSVPAAPARQAKQRAMVARIARPVFYDHDDKNERIPVGPVSKEGLLADALITALTDAANSLFRRTPGWECVTAGYDKDPYIFLVLTGVISPAPAEPQRWQVGVGAFLHLGKKAYRGGKKAESLQWENQRVWVTLGRSARADPEPGPMQIEAAGRLREIIEAWTDPVPCTWGAKINGQLKHRPRAEATWQWDWKGEGSFTLRPDGDFEASIAIPTQVSWTVGSCSASGSIDRHLRVAGYFDDDGRLVFSRMAAEDVGIQGKVTCQTPRGPVTLPAEPPGNGEGNWLGEDEFAIALEDGAGASIPPPSGCGPCEWKVTLELRNTRESPPRPVAAPPGR